MDNLGLIAILVFLIIVIMIFSGRKVIYGRVNSTKEIKMFEYDRISNIKIIDEFRFSPLIPITQYAS